MSGVGDIWTDMMANFFRSETHYMHDDSPNNSPRRRPAEGSVYETSGSVYQTDSVYESGSVYETGSVYGNGSVLQGSVLQDGSAYRAESRVESRASNYQPGSKYVGGAEVTGYRSFCSPRGRSPTSHGSPLATYRSPSYEQPKSFVPGVGGGYPSPIAQGTPRASGSRPSFGPPAGIRTAPGSYVAPGYRPNVIEKAPFESLMLPFKDGTSRYVAPKMDLNDCQRFLKGASFLQTEAYRARNDQFFISDMEDIVDVQLADFLEARPETYLKTRLTRIRPGVYSIYDKKDIRIEWVEATHGQGQLIVKDGPVRLPIIDYLNMEDARPVANYNGSIFQARNNLERINKESRMTFVDTGIDYTRVEAMKVAQEQAMQREAAAGRQVQHHRQMMVHQQSPQKPGSFNNPAQPGSFNNPVQRPSSFQAYPQPRPRAPSLSARDHGTGQNLSSTIQNLSATFQSLSASIQSLSPNAPAAIQPRDIVSFSHGVRSPAKNQYQNDVAIAPSHPPCMKSSVRMHSPAAAPFRTSLSFERRPSLCPALGGSPPHLGTVKMSARRGVSPIRPLGF